MADFFDKSKNVQKENKEEPKEVKEEAPKKVKVGEDEYTQEELADLVGLGKIGKEAEEKYDTKIGKVWPEYTKAQQRLKEQVDYAELKKFKEEVETKATQEKLAKGEELSPEEQVKQALTEADRIGILTKENVGRYVSQILAARDLLDECKDFESTGNPYEEKTLPKFKTKDMLEYMQESGIKNPRDAYDVKYKDKIAAWKEKEVSKAKPKGLITEETSVPGGKKPKEVAVGPKNLQELTKAALRGEL